MIRLPVSKTAFSQEQLVEEGNEAFLINLQSTDIDVAIQTQQQSDILTSGKDSVLIVEDNAELRQFMSATIQENKFTVLTAADGLEALQLAMKFVPSLVLTDLMMPRMNGMELTKKLKEDERTSHIPIILLTAKNESQSRLGALRTGADDYLTKPFSPDELLARITNLIEQRKKLAEKFRERILVPATISEDVSMDERFLHKVRTAVETNMSDYTFTVERLADEINLSRTQLLRKLKALTGLSPNDFIKDIRLKRASDMIRQRVDTITQIGYAVGFNDQSYFTKCFKKQFRLTPSEYLASQSPSNK
jgi:DNA-binding response OmpR family regulator